VFWSIDIHSLLYSTSCCIKTDIIGRVSYNLNVRMATSSRHHQHMLAHVPQSHRETRHANAVKTQCSNIVRIYRNALKELQSEKIPGVEEMKAERVQGPRESEVGVSGRAECWLKAFNGAVAMPQRPNGFVDFSRC